MSLLAEPLVVDGVTVAHTFEEDVSIPLPVDDVTLAEHARRFAHWQTLAVKAAFWVARLKKEAADHRRLAVANVIMNNANMAAMAAGIGSRGKTAAPKPRDFPKWKAEMQSDTDPEYVDMLRDIAKAEETAERLSGWVEALRQRGQALKSIVDLTRR